MYPITQVFSSAKDIFDEKSLTEFWPFMIDSYPKVTKKALHALIPFISMYLCESGFSTLLLIKSKPRNRLDVENCQKYPHGFWAW